MLPPTPNEPGPTAPTIQRCYRHPEAQTGVRCTRCGRPICPSCMIPAAVGHQCPECLEEARREYRRGPGNLRRRVRSLTATRVLLAAIVVMFVVEVVSSPATSLFSGPDPRTLYALGASYPLAIAAGEYWRLFTAMFLHANLIHVALNGYMLWFFGQAVEEEYGTAWTAVLFVLTGLLASVTSYAFGLVVALGVGASGAIAGLFGVFVGHNFRRRHLALASARLRSAVTLIMLNALLAFAIPEIDWRAHLGGMAAGFAAAYLIEGVGPRPARTAIRVAGLAALVALGIALVVWRTETLRALPVFA